MNLLERVLTLLRANLNTVVEKADDPEKVLQQLQLDMRNQLVQVKTQVATAIAESHRLQKRSKERQTEAALWYKKAEQAIQQDNDDAARTALTRRNDILKQSQRYAQQQQEQEQLVVTMRKVLRELEAKIAEVETTIDLLSTRKRNAILQQRVFDALGKNNNPKDMERAAKARDAVMEAEARARALADLHKRDLVTQLDQLDADQSIEHQLQLLKNKQQAGPSNKTKTPLLPEGNGQAASLLRPQPQSGNSLEETLQDENEQPRSRTTSSAAKENDIARLNKLLESKRNASS
jgi:phage shock protein A